MTARRTMWHLGASALAALLLTTFTPTPAQAAGEHFNISASEGRPGMTGGFTQDDPCPTFVDGPGAWQVVEFVFTDSAGTVFNVRDAVGANPDGTWQGEARFTIPYRSLGTPYGPPGLESEEAAPGMGAFTARCVLHPGGTVVQEYAPQPFNVTGVSHTFSVAPTTVAPSGDVTISSAVDTCPSDQVEVTIGDTMYLRITEPRLVPDANGAWSVTLPASQPQWDGPDVPFNPGAGVVRASCMSETTGRVVFAYADQPLTIGGGTTPPTNNCKDVLFIGLAGSGQSSGGSDDPSTFSPEVSTAFEGFKQKLKAGKTYKIRMIDYPALPVDTIGNYGLDFHRGLREYIEGKNAGVRKTRHLVEQQLNNCPNQLITLAGYSQGALVVHEYLTEHAKTYNGWKKQAIASAVTIADPAQFRDANNSDVLNFGDAPPNGMGICQYLSVKCFKGETLADIPGAYMGRTVTVCDKKDIVCDHLRMASTPLPGMGIPEGKAVHLGYGYDPNVELAGKWAAQKVNARWS